MRTPITHFIAKPALPIQAMPLAQRRAALRTVIFSFAALAMAGLGASQAWAATNKPVAGVGVRCCKRPNGANARILPQTSGINGRFELSGQEAGDYDVTVAGGANFIFKVGSDGKLMGEVQETADGKLIAVQIRTSGLSLPLSPAPTPAHMLTGPQLADPRPPRPARAASGAKDAKSDAVPTAPISPDKKDQKNG